MTPHHKHKICWNKTRWWWLGGGGWGWKTITLCNAHLSIYASVSISEYLFYRKVTSVRMLHETDYRKLLTFADGIVFPQTQSQWSKQHVILAVILHHTTIIFHYHFVSLVFSSHLWGIYICCSSDIHEESRFEKNEYITAKKWCSCSPPPPPKYLRQIILYVNCFGRTVLYMCIEYHI